MNRRRFCFAMGSAAAALLTEGAQAAENPLRHKMTAKCFGASTSIVVHCQSKQLADTALKSAFDELERIESVMSIYRPDSQVARLNRTGRLTSADPMLLRILHQAREFSELTGAAFDITVQPLWELFQSSSGDLPSEQAVRRVHQRVGFEHVVLERDSITLRKGAALTLNGIAQGFATDRVRKVLLGRGIKHAMLDTGEISSLGERTAGRAWKVGIQHPRVDDAFAAVVALGDRCLATSGDYASAFTEDLRCHHIFNPRTGRSPTEIASVSVLAPTAIEADALSTALLVMGMEDGAKLLTKLSGVDALFIKKNGDSLATSGFPRGGLQ